MFKLNFLVILGLCCLINSLPVDKYKLFPVPPLRHLRVRNSTISTTSETMETKVKTTAEPLEARSKPHLRVRNSTISTTAETVEIKVKTTAEPLEARLYELVKKMGVPYTRSSVGRKLFGYEKPATKMNTPRPSRKSFGGHRKLVKLWPQEDETENKADKEEESNEKADKDETYPRRNKGRVGGKPKEITLRVPHMKKDQLDNWVYNPWGVTFGHPFMDTRFANVPRHGFEVVRFRVHDKGMQKYNPTADGAKSTVCRSRTTIYNYPKVKYWLQRLVHNVSFDRRTIWMDLRRELAERGRSEECHTAEFSDFQAYQECAMKRNQRLEYLIPQYPLHQIGYRKYYSQGQSKEDDPIEIR